MHDSYLRGGWRVKCVNQVLIMVIVCISFVVTIDLYSEVNIHNKRPNKNVWQFLPRLLSFFCEKHVLELSGEKPK
jgi:hypothetical protein